MMRGVEITEVEMIDKIKAVFVGSGCTALLMLSVYVALAAIACVTSWSNDYWNLANWDEVSRFVLAMLWAGIFLVGAISTYELVKQVER